MNNIAQESADQSASKENFFEVVAAKATPRAEGERISYREWTDTKALKAALKAAGWNGRKVSVSARHTVEYIKVTVRSADVDVAKLEKFIEPMNTWRMSMDDCTSGQSVTVTVSDEVREAYGEKNKEFIKARFEAEDFEGLKDGQGIQITEEVYAWRESQYYGYLQARGSLKKYEFRIAGGLDYNRIGSMYEFCKLRAE